MSIKWRIFIAVFSVSVVLDYLTKQLIAGSFYYGERLPIIEGLLDLTHVRNPGGAFSFFAQGPAGLRMTFFVGTTLVAVVLLLVFLRRLPPLARLPAFALGAIMGGAIGNLFDRIRYGEVIDFIDVHLWGGRTWPTFNIADSCIVVGVAILMIDMFMTPEEDESPPPAASPSSP